MEKSLTYLDLLLQINNRRNNKSHYDSCIGIYGDNSIRGIVELLVALDCNVPVYLFPPDMNLEDVKTVCAVNGITELFYEDNWIKIESEIVPDASVFDTAIALLTTGSSGESKVVALSIDSINYNIEIVKEAFGITAEDRILLYRTAAHAFSLICDLLVGLSVGATIFIENNFYSIRRNIARNRITYMTGIGDLIAVLFSNTDVSSVKKVLLGGSSLFAKTLCKIREHYHGQLFLGYGLTEMGPMVSYREIFSCEEDPISVGQVFNGVKIVFCKCDIDNEISISNKYIDIGRIIVSSPGMMLGYIQNGQLHRVVWINTNDFGMIDDNKNLFILGRTNRTISVMGKTIPLLYIELQIKKKLGLDEVAVVSSDRNDAYLVCFDPQNHTSEEEIMIKHRINNLCYELVKVRPKCILEDRLPHYANGKVNYRNIKERHE